MPLAGMAFSLLEMGDLANPKARSLEMMITTFLALAEFGWPDVDHWHKVGSSRCGVSTLAPRTALTCACVTREQGSLAVAACAKRGLQMPSAQKKATAARVEYFECTVASSITEHFA